MALLFNYVEDKLLSLRPLGIRGSIELAVVYDRLRKGTKHEIEQELDEQTALLGILQQTLELSEPGIRNLIRNIHEDGKVMLLWRLYFESFPHSTWEELN
jgi:hypothetical protein